MSESVSVSVTIVNKLGLHARPAMCFVDVATQFVSEIVVKRGDQAVDGKSIMQMMLLAATKGTALEIVATGADAATACQALKKLVDSGFDED
ncbi:MAG: HPr family phosphocarrier protein [Phycisphaerales bacterium]